MIKRYLLYLTFVTIGISTRAQVMINEIMQSNIDCIMDDTNEFPDSWVELYNAGNETVDMANYSLGLTDNPQEAWQLPHLNLAGHSYRILRQTGKRMAHTVSTGVGKRMLAVPFYAQQ